MQSPLRHTIHFVTGTDTGVGKTILTASLLFLLREQGVDALAMKPFSSGDRHDAHLLQSLQRGRLSLDECNPFHVRAPIAPYAAGCRTGRWIAKSRVVQCIASVARRCEVLLVEGAGGLMTPLGRGYHLGDLMAGQLRPAMVWVAARNALGTINHSRLTLSVLEGAVGCPKRLVMMPVGQGDASTRDNARILGELAGCVPVVRFPDLGLEPSGRGAFEKKSKKIEKVLAPVLGLDKVRAAFRKTRLKTRG